MAFTELVRYNKTSYNPMKAHMHFSGFVMFTVKTCAVIISKFYY